MCDLRPQVFLPFFLLIFTVILCKYTDNSSSEEIFDHSSEFEIQGVISLGSF